MYVEVGGQVAKRTFKDDDRLLVISMPGPKRVEHRARYAKAGRDKITPKRLLVARLGPVVGWLAGCSWLERGGSDLS